MVTKTEIIPLLPPSANGGGQAEITPRQHALAPQVTLPAAAGQSPEPAGLGRGINPLLSLKSHKLLALALAAAITAVGIPVAMVLGKNMYQTEAVVYVSPRFLKNLNSDQELELQSNSQYREFVQQQVYTINRFDIVSDALKRLGERRSLYQIKQESERVAAERLARELIIRPVPDTYLITVGLEGDKPDGLAEVINAVVETYLERSKSEEIYAADERVKNIQVEQKKLLDEIQQKTAQRTELAQEIGVTTFTASLLNPYDQLLISAKDALEAARRRRIDAGAQLDALERAQQPGGKSAADAQAQEQAIKDNGFNSLKANLYLRRSQLLAKLSGLTPEHPGYRAIKRELAEIDVEIGRAQESLTTSFRSMLLDQKRAELFQAQKVEKDLAAEVEAQSSRAMWFASRYHQALALSEEIDRLHKRVAAIDERADFLMLEATAPGFIRLVTPARKPEGRSKGGRKKIAALFLLAGLAIALIAPIAIDYFDPRVHAASELQRVLGFPPAGWILDRQDEPTRHFAQDQLIRLATGLDRERRTQGSRIFAFTSTRAGEGTTTLVLELTQALIRLGVRAVAVEANAFKADARYLGERSSPGLVALLEGGASVADIVTPGDGLLPERVRIGRVECRRLPATISQLGRALDELAHRYEIVLLDAPPLLLSSDAELVISQADAAMLVVMAQGESRAQIKRAARALERLSPPVVGAILVRVRAASEGGYFAGLLKEHQSGRRTPASRLLSPWLWK
jgi:Mrp family chromosome partitioning ATPase